MAAYHPNPIPTLKPEGPNATLPGPLILGGSWVVVRGVIRRVTIVIIHISGLRAPLITTHEPPSKCLQAECLKPEVTSALGLGS